MITQNYTKGGAEKMVVPHSPCSYSCCSAPMVKKSKFGLLEIHQHLWLQGQFNWPHLPLIPFSALLAVLCSAGHASPLPVSASQPTAPVALHLQALPPSLDDFQHLPATAYEVHMAWPSTSSSGPHPSLVQIMRPCHNIRKAGAGKKAQLCWHESIQAHTQFGKKWMWPWEEGWGSRQLSCKMCISSAVTGRG